MCHTLQLTLCGNYYEPLTLPSRSLKNQTMSSYFYSADEKTKGWWEHTISQDP